MAGFKTHIGTSSLLGVAYGATGFLGYEVPLPTCILAGGLCSISGMLPDLDSPSGNAVREITGFAAAVVPMLLLDRFREYGMTNETVVLAGGLIYLVLRFGLSEFLKRYTVHRGMWHSVPAAIIAGLVAFLLCSCDSAPMGLFKAGGVVAGYVSHLLLDEIYSIQWYRGRFRLKRSFGTAFKFVSSSPWANLSTYGKLALLLWFVTGDQRLPTYLQRNVDQQAVEALPQPMSNDVFDYDRYDVANERPHDDWRDPRWH